MKWPSRQVALIFAQLPANLGDSNGAQTLLLVYLAQGKFAVSLAQRDRLHLLERKWGFSLRVAATRAPFASRVAGRHLRV